MKYSLMSLMLNKELKVSKPNFIHMEMAKKLGYFGDFTSLEKLFCFLHEKGIPIQNGTMEFEDFVRFAKESGYDGIDMMSFHFEEDGEKAKTILEKYGITLSAVNIIVPFINATTQEQADHLMNQVSEVIDRAYDAGCRNILLMPSVYQAEKGITREHMFHNIVRGLSMCVEYGREMGMTINTETLESVCVPLCSNGEMMRLFEAVPGLKYTHDTGNPLVANEDPLYTYELFQEKVVSVHFKDMGYKEAPTRIRTAAGLYLDSVDFGTGEIDFQEHLKLLHQDHYEGFITLEGTVPAADLLDSAKKSLAYFRAMEAKLK